MKIVFFGLFGCGNLGNDGSLQAAAGRIRSLLPDARLTAVCYDMEVVRERLDIETVPISISRTLGPRLRMLDKLLLKIPGKLADAFRALRVMAGADAMIIPGTGILDDFGERFYGMPLTIFLWTLAARLTGSRVAFVSIGAGPIRNRHSRWLMVSAARLAHYRSYRDKVSHDFMTDAGLDTAGDPIYPDIVFSLPAPDIAARNGENSGLTVGIGVMNYAGWYHYAASGKAIYDRYINDLADFVVWLLDGGYRIRLLTGELNDQVAIEDLSERLREMRPDIFRDRVIAEPAYSLIDLMRQLGKTDVAVVSRFHNVVCAIKMAVPVMSLGYAAKNEVLLEEAGLTGLSQHMEGFDPDRLKEQFRRLVAGKDKYRETVRERCGNFVDRLAVQEKALFPDPQRSSADRRRQIICVN